MNTGVGSRLNAETARRGPDEQPHPWRRYFARLLDMMIGGLAMGLLASLLLAIIAPDAAKALADFTDRSANSWFNGMALLVLAMIPNALLIGYTGTSIGKWLLGVRVTNLDGRPVGPGAALRREIMVWFRGLGIGFPFVSLITLITAYKRLKNDGQTSWDRDMSLRVRHESPSVFAILGMVALLMGVVFLNVMGR